MWVEMWKRNVQPGAILHLYCEFTTPPKNKFLVVASTEPRLLLLVVNSEINQFYIRRSMEHLHVPLAPEIYPFLKKESFANCVETHNAFTLEQVHELVIDNYNETLKGHLSPDCRKAIYLAIKENKTMKRELREEILSSLSE